MESKRRSAVLAGAAFSFLMATALAEGWPGYERLTREQLLARLTQAGTDPPSLAGKNFSGLALSGIDFRRANLSASVFNRATLTGAPLDGCNLTLSFLEAANPAKASLTQATLFSAQLAGAVLSGANLTGARPIGHLTRVDLSHARLV